MYGDEHHPNCIVKLLVTATCCQVTPIITRSLLRAPTELVEGNFVLSHELDRSLAFGAAIHYRPHTSLIVLPHCCDMDFLEVYDDNIDDKDDNFPAFIDGIDDQTSLGPFAATTKATVMEALKLAKVAQGDVVIDLGSGDGRFCTAAVQKFNADMAVGFESDPALVELSEDLAKKCGVQEKVSFTCTDFSKLDYKNFMVHTKGQAISVVIVFLLPESEEKFRHLLLQFYDSGARIVVVLFALKTLAPSGKIGNCYVYQKSSS